VGTLDSILRDYGLLGLYFASAVEGDLTLLAAGLLIHTGTFPPEAALVVGVAGMLSADLFLFSLGRYSQSTRLFGARAEQVLERAGRLLERYGAAAVAVVRLFYGIRNATFFLCGRREWAVSRFVAGDLVGAACWATMLLTLGYTFSSSIDTVFGEVEKLEHRLLILLLVSLPLVFAARRFAKKAAPVAGESE